MQLATMDEWFELTARYPEFRKVTNTALKDFGVMKSIDYIERRILEGDGQRLRILEFGHGFNPYLMARFQETCEVWGADRDQGLPYFDSSTWEERFNSEVRSKCPKVRFVRALVGESVSELPENYFDVIVSVSVLEEMPIYEAGRIVAAAAKLLKQGGALIGSYDPRLPEYKELSSGYYEAHRKAGLATNKPPRDVPDVNGLLLENPTAVMVWYQGAEAAASRKYRGHFGTMFTVGVKGRSFW